MTPEDGPVVSALREHTPRNACSLLLAVSGGADSMAMLHGYHHLGIHRIEVAHVDHGIRSDSAEHANFVKAQCKRRNLVVHVRTLRAPLSGNLEQWGRVERYRYFAELLENRNLDLAVTAHTANDCAETLLMRLVTNKDLRSIIGHDPERRCLRPLKYVYRREIERYLSENQVPFLHDPTNDDRTFLRNRVRHELLPFLSEKFDGDLVRIIALRAQIVAEDLSVLDQLASEKISCLRHIDWGEREWLRELRKVLRAVPPGLAWRVAEAVLFEKIKYRVGKQKSEEFLAFAMNNAAGMQISGGFELRRAAGGIQLRSTNADVA